MTIDPALTRRRFLAATGAAALAAPTLAARRGRQDVLNVGLIGCGGRGTGAAANALEAGADVRIVALGDLFPDRLAESRRHLAGMGDRAAVADAACFVGFDAYRDVIAQDVDVVILATPPHFRPIHFAAAIDAGRHVFMEKPVAVDPVGARAVMEAARRARAQGLSVVAGTQRRHEACYLAAMDQIASGAIGDVTHCRVYWNQGGLWVKERQPGWSDMEWQCRNWLYFDWLSGDHVVEQHIHNLDVANWVMGGPPARAIGLGGRQERIEERYGSVYDHFAVDFEYPDGRTVLSMCRQQNGTPGRVEEIVHGTAGTMRLSSGRAQIDGAWRFRAAQPSPYVQEHVDLQASIRSAAGLNEGERVAESTMTAIMARLACYTGQEITWKQMMESTLDLSPDAYAFGPMPTPAVAVPGRTPFV